MSLHVDLASDWGAPYPFRLIRLESEHDKPLGQWSVEFAFLGLAATLTWVYEQTKLRAELSAMMEGKGWLSECSVYLPHADYEALKSDADKWRALIPPDAGAGV